jgi:hypothetical protein
MTTGLFRENEDPPALGGEETTVVVVLDGALGVRYPAATVVPTLITLLMSVLMSNGLAPAAAAVFPASVACAAMALAAAASMFSCVSGFVASDDGCCAVMICVS